MSEERKKYLRKIRTKKYLVLGTQILLLIVFLGIWEMAANSGAIDSFITSSPSRIIETFKNFASNNILEHVQVTCYETIVGFLLGTIMGIGIAIILWWSEFIAKVLDPYLVVLNSLPKVALRTNNYYMGRSRNTCNYSYGSCNIFSCYNFRKS